MSFLAGFLLGFFVWFPLGFLLCAWTVKKLIERGELKTKIEEKPIDVKNLPHEVTEKLQRLQVLENEWTQQMNSFYHEFAEIKELVYKVMRLKTLAGDTLGEFLGAHNFIKDKQDMEPQ